MAKAEGGLARDDRQRNQGPRGGDAILGQQASWAAEQQSPPPLLLRPFGWRRRDLVRHTLALTDSEVVGSG